MSQKFYEGTYLARVLSDRPQGDVSGLESLMHLLGAAINGDCVGTVETVAVQEVNGIHMAELLNAAGSEPEFFQLSDAQDLAGALYDSASIEGCSPDLVVVERAAYNDLMNAVGLSAYVVPVAEEDES